MGGICIDISEFEDNIGLEMAKTHKRIKDNLGKEPAQPPQLNTLIAAGEILRNKRYFEIFLTLAISHGSITELAKQTNLPYTSVYKFLKRLENAGVIAKTYGINRRRSYYKLTEKGKKVAARLKKMILKNFGTKYEIDKGVYFIPESIFDNSIRKMGLDKEKIVRFLGANYITTKINYEPMRGYEFKL